MNLRIFYRVISIMLYLSLSIILSTIASFKMNNIILSRTYTTDLVPMSAEYSIHYLYPVTYRVRIKVFDRNLNLLVEGEKIFLKIVRLDDVTDTIIPLNSSRASYFKPKGNGYYLLYLINNSSNNYTIIIKIECMAAIPSNIYPLILFAIVLTLILVALNLSRFLRIFTGFKTQIFQP